MDGRTVLVLGASGFIGSHAADAFAAAGWTVVAGARRPEAARRLAPDRRWLEVDFARLRAPADWAPLLAGVDAVVNCVGVLQDGGGDSVEAAHVTGPAALIQACEAAGVRRFVHLSAVGADEAAGTAYARTKRRTEAMLEASALDWVVVRPSLVLARGVYGGTGLLRALAAMPLAIPVAGGEQMFRPIGMDDLCAALVRLADADAPSRLSLDAAGGEALSLADLLAALRAWLGFAPAPVLRLPRAAAAPILLAGDLAGRLGWSSPLRTTSIRQMDHDVAGDPEALGSAAGLVPRGARQWLAQNPATLPDRWHARLYFVRPIAVVTLGLFWLLTGLITLGPGREEAAAILRDAGFGGWSAPAAIWGAWLDVALGLALFARSWTARVALLMVLATVGYLIGGTLWLDQPWSDPMGPLLKVFPMMALALFVAATDARR